MKDPKDILLLASLAVIATLLVMMKRNSSRPLELSEDVRAFVLAQTAKSGSECEEVPKLIEQVSKLKAQFEVFSDLKKVIKSLNDEKKEWLEERNKILRESDGDPFKAAREREIDRFRSEVLNLCKVGGSGVGQPRPPQLPARPPNSK